jgi:hypothetical protein
MEVPRNLGFPNVELTDEGDRRFAEAFEALAGARRALRKFVTKL